MPRESTPTRGARAVARILLARAARMLACLAALAICAPGLAAQIDDVEPWIEFDPVSGDTIRSATLGVSIRFRDDVSLNLTTRTIQLNGVNVTGWTHSPVGPSLGMVLSTSSGTVTLSPGTNTLTASVCDSTAKCSGTYTATYVYTPANRPGVRVTPDGGTVQLAASTSHNRAFLVKNTGTLQRTFSLRAICRDAWSGAQVSGCTASSSVTLNAGDSSSVNVSVPVGAAGQVLLVRLVARDPAEIQVEDAGWIDVTAKGTGSQTVAPAPALALVDLNQRPTSDRSSCVTVAVASGMAYECGDLRVVHGLPGTRVRNRAWVPSLLYNSQHATPRPTVYADVTLASNALVPDSVKVSVALSGGATHTQSYPGSQWAPGTTRRVAVQWDGGSMLTGIYPLQVQATSHYPSTTQSTSAQTDTVVVVNRSASNFGGGWWVAGWEQLCIGCNGVGSSILWIGGDGSTRLFQPQGGGVWTAYNPAGTPDTMVSRTVGSTTYYARKLRGGGEVHFTTGGVHFRTVNRLNQLTTFTVDPTTQRLTAIHAPDSAAWWTVGYNGSGKATSYVANATGATARTTNAAISSLNQLYRFTDPGTLLRQFGFVTGTMRINAYDDRRDTRHYVYYDSAGKLSQVRLRMSSTATSAADLLTSFEAAEGKGYLASVATEAAYTRIDGPREDVLDHTYIWLTSRGAPRRIRDVLGSETLLTRGDTFPALVREVRSTDARGDTVVLRSRAQYDTRGRVTRSTVYGMRTANDSLSTTYTWDDRWNAVRSITTPGTGVVSMAYDTLTGNRLWQQVGDSTRRVAYRYYTSGTAAGLVKAIQYPQVDTLPMIDSIGYDARGNLALTRTPMGFLTLYRSDALGRDTLVITPIQAGKSSTIADVDSTGMRQRTEFDAAGRVWRQHTIGPAMIHNRFNGLARVNATGQEMLSVENVYDAGGLVTQVRRWATPDTAHIDTLVSTFEYDWAGRRTSSTEAGTGVEGFVYDKAGNVVQWDTKRGYAVTSEYDVAGRLTRRIVPPILHFGADISCADFVEGPNCSFDFPGFPNHSGGRYETPADTAWYRYDVAGRMTYGENLDAIVQRSYLPGGALDTDTLRIRSYTGGRFDTHVYGLQYRYDALGRMRALLHPSNLAGTAQRDSFAYNAVTSALDTVVSRTGHAFGFERDVLGRVTTERLPGGASRSYAYDRDGRKTTHDSTPLTYDARGKVLSATYPQSSEFYNTYSGLGMLVGTDWDNVNNSAVNVSDFALDALGNTVWTRTANDLSPTRPEHRYHYQPGTSRVLLISNKLPTWPADQGQDSMLLHRDSTWRAYDDAGNVYEGQTHSWGSGYGKVATRSYFGADERLRAIATYDTRGVQTPTGSGTPESRGSFVEYRYDPLGRRVLVRTRRDGMCSTGSSDVDCTGGIERIVWAGDNVLWELRGPGADSVSIARLENETASGVEFGAVGYTHAGGVDRPLLAWKGTGNNPAMVVIPHMSWRGTFGGGTYMTGTVNTYPIVWPGFQRTAWHKDQPNQQQTKVWTGSLLEGQRDASGQMYMRNRYYDPVTGQFTQTDPIGLAGGMNAYGFAAGDPVTYSDPYGLAVCGRTRIERRRIEETYRVDIEWDEEGCVRDPNNVTRIDGSRPFRRIQDDFLRLVADDRTFTVSFRKTLNPRTWAGSRIYGGGQRWTIYIDPRQTSEPYFYENEWGGCAGRSPWGVHALIAHELGHALLMVQGRDWENQEAAIAVENLWNRAVGRPDRSYRCHP